MSEHIDKEATVALVKRITDLDITRDKAISIEHEMFMALLERCIDAENAYEEMRDQRDCAMDLQARAEKARAAIIAVLISL